ncbi:dTMP kinase [Candidatus Bathyarchaeota archaeon]|nr:dTMP kinase [Candidatus Bathyarchaeota archaeon]
MERKGFFVCVEGLDGCGKTTQAKRLVAKLKESYDAFYTAEPSQGPIGEFIRKCYLHAPKRGSTVVEALLFAADRIEHLESEVIPALNAGKLVISDRYLYSSLAYQGAAGLDLNWIERINEHAIRPDLAVFIDVEPETVVCRLKAKKSVMENLETQRSVREVYMKFVEKGDLVRIDGNVSEAKVAERILAVVIEFLEKAC